MLEQNSDGVVQIIVYSLGTAMLVYVYFCRFFQTNKGLLGIMNVALALIFTVSDVLLLILDYSNFPTTRSICIVVFLVSAILYQLIHMFVSFATSQYGNQTVVQCAMSYLIFIMMLTIITEAAALYNFLVLNNDQPMVERVALIAINLYFCGMVPFFIGRILQIFDERKIGRILSNDHEEV